MRVRNNPRPGWRERWLGLWLLLLPLLTLAEPAAPQTQLSDGYTEQTRCSACHAGEAAAWAGSHHSWSLREAVAGNVLGDFADVEYRDEAGVVMRFFRRGERFFVNAEGEDGRRADFAIVYTFGFDPLQQYLIERPGGRLQSLTVAWDSRSREAGGQRWFSLYPGQRFSPDDALHWTGRYQNWNAMCADCHSGNLKKGYDPASDSFRTTWSEMAVGCQSCHGPGERHVVWAERRGAQATAKLTAADMGLVVDFRGGGHGYEVEQCARCHSRRESLGAGSAPGRPLLDAMRPTVLSAGLYHADGQILDEVFEYGSFVQSRMFAMGVTCRDCHEPHSGRLRAEGNALCAGCHNPQGNPRFPSLQKKPYDDPSHHFHPPGSPGAQCVNCHIPTRTYMVVDARRDHSFRIPRPELDARSGAPDACTGCHQDRDAAWAAQAIEAKVGQPQRPSHHGEVLAAARRRDPQVVGELARLIADTTRPAILRASAAELAAGYGTPLLDSLQQALGDADAQVRMVAVRGLESLPAEQRLEHLTPLLDDPSLAVRDQAAHALADLRGALLADDVRARLDALLGDLERRLAANSDLPGGRLNLAVLHERLGLAADAEADYRMALRQDAHFTPARVNLAQLLAGQGRLDDTESLLRAGLALQPEGGALADQAYALGLLLAQRGQGAEAADWLRRAADAQPQRVRIHYNLGLLLGQLGRIDEASAALLRGLALAAADRDLLYALAHLNYRTGRYPLALGYSERLLRLQPQEAAYRRLHESILRESRQAAP
ncbi:MAG: tetratricopeptide repeat protein [Pseudomonas sp.]|nr:tetratricopeptide repeat protein [Pseudomonas sp.]